MENPREQSQALLAGLQAAVFGGVQSRGWRPGLRSRALSGRPVCRPQHAHYRGEQDGVQSLAEPKVGLMRLTLTRTQMHICSRVPAMAKWPALVVIHILLLCNVCNSAEVSSDFSARFRNGDVTAIEETVRLPIPEATEVLISGIWEFYRQKPLQKKHPGYMQKLGRALAELPGHADVMKERIAQLSSKPGTALKRRGYFEVLGVVASSAAIEVACGFLWDDKVFQDDELAALEGGVAGSNSSFAVTSLAYMNLEDAPTKKPYYRQGPKDLILWRRWWMENRGQRKVEK